MTSQTLSDLGSGVLLAWVALPLLAATAARGGRVEAASHHRALIVVLTVGCALVALPFLRAAAGVGARIDLPVQVAHALHATRETVVATRFGDASPLGLVAMAWLVAVTCVAARALVDALTIARVVHRSGAPSEVIAARVELLARGLGVRAPRVRVSDACIVPFTAGVLWPTVVLPRAVVDDFEVRALDLILLHELAHVARRDTLTHALLVVPRVVLALHPTARALFAEIDLARELAVDADVSAVDGEAYPKVLIDVACHARFGVRLFGAVGMQGMHRTDLALRLEALADDAPRRPVTPMPALLLASLIVGSALVAPRLESTCPMMRASHGPCASQRAPTSATTL